MDLLSLVLTVRPAQRLAELPPVGRAAHALLLAAIGDTNPTLAERVHAGSGVRPFTASGLVGQRRNLPLLPEQNYRLRFTALAPEVARAVLQAAQSGRLASGQSVELSTGAHFHITASDWGQSAANVWAAQTTYEALSAPWLLGRQKPNPRYEFEFASPTAFKLGNAATAEDGGFAARRQHLPVPLPRLVFNSLLSKWNAFAPVALPEEASRFAEECLALTAYQLKTQAVPIKDSGWRVGAVGRVRYTALNADRYWLSLLHLLADFAVYAGVGVDTSWGMGQCRVIRRSEVKE
jgi:CRISPR-associated endoribonuclease Cas6